MTIRKAELEDAERIQQMVLSLERFYMDDPAEHTPEWLRKTLTLQAVKKRLTTEDYNCFVYLSENQIIGYIAVYKQTYLYHLFVDQEFHGQGIGKQLWHHVLTLYPDRQWTVSSSKYAVEVYRQFGFVEAGESYLKDGVFIQQMERLK